MRRNEMGEELLTTSEAAAEFGVDAKTVVRWADAGKIPHFRTLGGHRRFRASVVRELRRISSAEGGDTAPSDTV